MGESLQVSADHGEAFPTQSAAISSAGPNETAATAAAEKAKALVQAKFIMAMNRPRDQMVSREKILRDCKRPRFAESAVYRKPVGKGSVEGLSIRFAEAALRNWGNVDIETSVLYEDEDKRIIQVTVMDLETMVSYSRSKTIEKTVERKSLRRGQEVVSQRVNSNGEVVYVVKANDDELSNKESAFASKIIRNEGLRILPSDIKDEAMEVVRKTLADRAAKDPDAELKRLVDAFSRQNVTPKDLAAYLGHDISKVSTKELVKLREVYSTLQDGEASWHEIVSEPIEVDARPASGKAKPKTLSDLKEKS